MCYESFKGLEIDRMKIPLKELKIIGSFALVHGHFPGMENPSFFHYVIDSFVHLTGIWLQQIFSLPE